MARSRKKGKGNYGKYTIPLVTILVVGVIPAALFVTYVSSTSHNYTGGVHLAIAINGTAMVIPANVGVQASYWIYHGLDSYGIAGKAPLYTTDTTGNIRINSTIKRTYLLGEFFQIWGVELNSTCVSSYCNGAREEAYYAVTAQINGQFVSPRSTPFEQIVLTDRTFITISWSIAASPI